MPTFNDRRNNSVSDITHKETVARIQRGGPSIPGIHYQGESQKAFASYQETIKRIQRGGPSVPGIH